MAVGETDLRIPVSVLEAMDSLSLGFFAAGHCHIDEQGTARKPRLHTVVSAAIEVARRHPGELRTAIIARTQNRPDGVGAGGAWAAPG